MTPATPFSVLIHLPDGLDGARLAAAGARAGAIVVAGASGGGAAGLRAALDGVAGAWPGLAGLEARAAADLLDVAGLPELPGLVVAPAALVAAEPGAVARLRARGARVLAEILRCEPFSLGLPVDGFVLRGHEAGGLVSEQTGFVLLQEARRLTELPLVVRGAATPAAAAALAVGGAAGVLLADELVALPEFPPLPEALARRALRVTGGETLQIEAGHGLYLRGLEPVAPPGGASAEERPGARLAGRVREASADGCAALADVAAGLTWSGEGVAPAGQGLILAPMLARRHRTLGRLVGAVRRAVARLPREAAERGALGPGGPLAGALGLRVPVFQGPMTRVSDVAGFSRAVAEGGALPFTALALLSGEASDKVLGETRALLGDLPWGVGLLGFADTKVLRPQFEAVARARPPFAIVAGGRINQVRELEAMGVSAFVHAPTPAMALQHLEEGCRRFVIEGRECGGHVGPLTSLALWGGVVEALRDHPILQREGSKVQVVLAGGIHDAPSAAMAATLAEPLAALGVQVGVLMGTAYLFTREVVEQGAVVPDYQDVALATGASGGTRCLWEGPGFASRVALTPIVEEFHAARAALEARGAPAPEMREALEHFSLGRLRMATKGLMRPGAGAPLAEVAAEERRARGMYMIGQVAALRDRVTTVAELHAEVGEGGAACLAARAEAISEAVERAAQAGDASWAAHVATPPAPPPADIAIVGMATLLPGSPSLQAFWRRILQGQSAIREVPPDRWDVASTFDADRGAPDKVYSRWGGFLDDVPFNPMDWGIPPTAVPSVDPMQLLALEVTRQALTDAGLADGEAPDLRARTSVILGFSGGLGEKGAAYATRAELPRLLGAVPGAVLERLPAWSEDSFAGLLPNVAAGRVANRMDFGGTNMTTDAACASSLAAVYTAVLELESGRTDLAVAGGIDSLQSPFGYLCFSKTQALSPRGVCNTFDKRADGIVISEGLAAVVLKRLADAERDGDRVYAVIKGIGASSDGRAKGLTAPLPAGQARALARAYGQAGFDPAAVELFEAHGTGTVAGDKAELETVTGALARAGAGPQAAAIGSVKTVIGHTKAAAGVAGLVKVALGLHHKVLPPHAKVEDPNAAFEDEAASLFLAQTPRRWVSPSRPRRAGVSSFGFGGTNFHVALEEHGDRHAPRPLADAGLDAVPFALAASTREELRDRVAALRAEAGDASLHALARRALARPGQGAARLAFVAASREEALARLDAAAAFLGSSGPAPQGVLFSEAPRLLGSGKLAFLFPGQGSQYPGMLRQTALLHPAVAEAVEGAEAALAGTPSFEGRRLARLLWPADAFTPDARKRQMAAITATEVAQPALGAVEAGLAALLGDLGIRPDMAAGHSYGELVALHVAGAFDLAALIRLSEARGRAMVKGGDPARPGAMAAVAADAAATRAAIEGIEGVVVANLNSPRQTVIAGPREGVGRAVAAAGAAGLQATPVPVSQAFHSPLMEPARKAFAEALAGVAWAATTLPVYSNTRAAPHAPDAEAQRETLARHLVSPVDFVGMVRAMAADGAAVFVELGPKSVLSGRIPEILGDAALAIPLDRSSGDAAAVVEGLARLWVEGAPVDFLRLVEGWSEAPAPAKADRPGTWLLNGAYARPAGAPMRDVTPPDPALIWPAHTPAQVPAQAPAEARAPAPAAGRSPAPIRAGAIPQPTAPAPARMIPSEEIVFMDIHEHDLRRGPPVPMDGAPGPLGEFHGMMVEFLRVQESVMLAYLGAGAPVAAPSSLRPIAVPQALAYAPVAAPAPQPVAIPVPMPLATAPAAPVASAPAALPVAPPAAAVPPAPSPKAAAATPRALDLMGAFVAIVADKTGYPEDALDPDQGMEADLGIDSIKRMEILGAVQKILPDEAAEAMRAQMDVLSELHTIREIVDFIQAKLSPGAAAPLAAEAQRPFDQAGGETEEAPLLPRFKQVPCAEGADHVPSDLPPGQPVLVTEAADGFHEAVMAALAAVGARPILLPAAVPPQDLASWADAAVPTGPLALVHLGARAAMPDLHAMDLARWRRVQAEGTKRLFEELQALAPRLREGGRVIAASETGGLFGRAAMPLRRGLSAAPGATGLVKALSLEWPLCSSKAIDLDPAEAPEARARHLAHELTFLRGRREAGYPGGLRTVLRTEPASLSPPESGLRPDASWVVLATGGARGITAECLRTLAPFGCRLVLVGRSPLPPREEPDTVALDAAGLRRRFLDEARAGGEKPRPAAVEARVARHLAAREMLANIDGLAALGATVEYRAADVTDEAAVAGLLADLYARHRRIDLVVHGAGLIEDSLLEAKSRESFDRVFDAKADSAFLLARGLRPATLKGLCLFTSVAGRYGNRGQADYAAANETLNRLAWELRRRWGAGVQVKAINWGPWGATSTGAGMVTEAVARQFESRGIGLVPARAGAEAFLREMLWSPGAEVESVAWVADGESMEEEACALPAPARRAPLGVGLTLLRRATVEGTGLAWRLDLVSAPYIDHHRFDGQGVMPVAAVMQALSEAPAALGDARPVQAIEDLQLFKGLTLGEGPLDCLIDLDPPAEDGRRRVTLRLAGEPQRARYRADLRFGAPVASLRSPAAPSGHAWGGPTAREAYRRWLSHGPRFQTIDRLLEVDAGGVLALGHGTRPADFVPVGQDAAWAFDPGLIDGMLQTVWIWSRAIQGASTLPLAVKAVRRFDGDPLLGPLTLRTDVLSEPQDPGVVTALRAWDRNGRLCYELEAFRGQSSRALNRLGGGWAGGERDRGEDMMEAAQ